MVPPVLPILGGGLSRRSASPPLAGPGQDGGQTALGADGEVRVPDDVIRAFETALNAALPQSLLPPQTRLIIEVDPDTRRFVYKSVDAKTGELVRQWPNEQILGMIRVMRSLSGLAVDGKA